MKEVIVTVIEYLEIFSFINLWNIIDIVLITLLLYNVLKPLRRTKGEQLIKGFICILAILKLSEILGFTALNWIIQSTLDFAVIAFIVVFQPEFRKILEKIGRHTVLNKKKIDNLEIHNLISNLERAIFDMSSTNTGALIAIMRVTPLDEYFINATALDAIVSEALLKNIFIDGSPLHDGSIVIADNRIKAANCVLPLTEKELPVEYGTRHRAAIGLSETCDAVVLVVSEETGKISLCVNGYLNRISDKIQFRKELQDLLIDNTITERKGFKIWKNVLKKK